mmetsp:Transcript_19729/g.33898  ORF Transcript_19729/g.33898 Transcript_19729/m.33898 type:complete len:91 (+) Transcript_19729:394-666(+)
MAELGRNLVHHMSAHWRPRSKHYLHIRTVGRPQPRKGSDKVCPSPHHLHCLYRPLARPPQLRSMFVELTPMTIVIIIVLSFIIVILPACR